MRIPPFSIALCSDLSVNSIRRSNNRRNNSKIEAATCMHLMAPNFELWPNCPAIGWWLDKKLPGSSHLYLVSNDEPAGLELAAHE